MQNDSTALAFDYLFFFLRDLVQTQMLMYTWVHAHLYEGARTLTA